MQEFICSPEDILGNLPEAGGGGGSPAPLALTVCALLSHATSPPRSPKDTPDPPYQTYQYHEDVTSDYASDVTETSIEVNYQRRFRYTEERFVSNFNNFADYSQNYTIDESEEYPLNYENNNTDVQGNYSPYGTNDGVRNRGPYYQNNRIQFVTPFCKGDSVLKSDNFEIYDTDEVDFPISQEENIERYDRSKMNLEIENNLNRDLTIETEAPKEDENRLLFTCLCLGTFFVSAIILIIYPL